MAFGAIRLKGGIINPVNIVVDGTVALLLGISAMVFLARNMNGLVADAIRRRAKKDVELPAVALLHTAFLFLTLVFILSQVYLLWTTLKVTVPALLVSYPTISWGFALIYLVVGIAASFVDLLNVFWFTSIGNIKTE